MTCSEAESLATHFMRSEIMYFIQNKRDVLAVDNVRIISDFYSLDELEEARSLPVFFHRLNAFHITMQQMMSYFTRWLQI